MDWYQNARRPINGETCRMEVYLVQYMSDEIAGYEEDG